MSVRGYAQSRRNRTSLARILLNDQSWVHDGGGCAHGKITGCDPKDTLSVI